MTDFSHRPHWDNQFAEDEDERNARLAARRAKKSARSMTIDEALAEILGPKIAHDIISSTLGKLRKDVKP